MTTNTDNKEKNIAAKEECGPEKDQKKDRRIYILSQEKPSLAVVKLGVPLIAGMFIMVLYNLVDTYFIGLMRDDYQLAAVNLAYPVMMISIAISNMIGTGASSLIARSLGAEDGAKARPSCGGWAPGATPSNTPGSMCRSSCWAAFLPWETIPSDSFCGAKGQ